MLSQKEMVSLTRVQILAISHNANVLVKGMNPTISYHLLVNNRETDLGEWKKNPKNSK